MRWLLQIEVMLGDLLLFVACGYTLWCTNGKSAILCLAALCVWKSVGGFEAWQPSTIKRFMRNAKELGL